MQDNQEKILQILKESSVRKGELKIYSFDQISKLLGVSTRTLYNYKMEGRLPLTIIGSKSYMTEDQLISFLKENEVKPSKVRRILP